MAPSFQGHPFVLLAQCPENAVQAYSVVFHCVRHIQQTDATLTDMLHRCLYLPNWLLKVQRPHLRTLRQDTVCQYAALRPIPSEG